MQRRVRREKLGRAARVELERQTGRINIKRVTQSGEHFLVVARVVAEEEGIAKSDRVFDDRFIRRKASLCQERSFDSITRAVPGMKRLHHRALLAKESAGCGGGDA